MLRRPIVPADCQHNAHMYYLLLPAFMDRQAVIDDLKRKHIWSVFHYVPLHSSPAGQRYGRAHGKLGVTDRVAATLLRLPMWTGLDAVQERVIDALSISLMAQERQA